MKNYSHILVMSLMLVSVVTAHASSGIPKDARKIDQINLTVNNADRSVIGIAGDASTLAYEKKSSDKLNINCREVIYEWITTTGQLCVWKDTHTTEIEGSLHAILTTRPVASNNRALTSYSEYCKSWSGRHHFDLEWITTTNLTINVYCAPRPESQKFIMSVEMSCERNPSVECVKMAQQFDQITPTISLNVGRPN